ncbi:phage portal protein [Enterococcus sp.]|uniref:phage portal protein n=1 Tax=Enterococcus sp. TaxID=35783 RepID=UPI00289CB0C6|nr:phage portal protein [Enterococcus sp.]
MAIAIDREQADDINNPSLELINYCVEEHEKEIPRLDVLFDYYNGNPHKIDQRPKDSPHDRDEIYVNNAKFVTDMMTGFMIGNPVSYSGSKERNIHPLTDALKKMKIKKHDTEVEKGLSAMGIGYELHYLSVSDGNVNPNVAWIDPRGMILVVDDTVERNSLFAIRPREKQKIDRSKYWEITVYSSFWTIIYKSETKKLSWDKMIAPPKIKENNYNAVPVVEFRNNEEKQGDYEQQLSQIDAYNGLQTDRIKDKKNFVKALMILYGFTLPNERPSEVNGSLVLNAPAKDEGGHAEFVTNTFNESEVQVLADAILDDFHKTTYIPNLNDENFAGTQSGEAMKFKLLGLLLALSVKTSYFEDGIRQRLTLITNILKIQGKNVEADDVEVKFKVNLPFNRKDVIEQIKDSQEFIPLLVSLGWLDDIDDPQEVVEMLNQQKEENMKLQAKALGVQASDSHSDLDDEPSEE